MNYFFKILLCFFLFTNLALADGHSDNTDYWNILNLIKEEPVGANFLKPIGIDEEKQFIALFNKDKQAGLFEQQKKQLKGNSIDIDEMSRDAMNSIKDIYKGDFHNDGTILYEVVIDGEGAVFYQLKDNHLIALNFNEIANKTYGDGNHLTGDALAPFIKDGKTYVRFFGPIYDSTNYDTSDLNVNTYLWKGDKIDNTGPNFTGDKLEDVLKPCNVNSFKMHVSQFKKLYGNKNYPAAYQTLNQFATACSAYNYDPYDWLDFQNNMLITLVHLQDKKACTNLMSDMKKSNAYQAIVVGITTEKIAAPRGYKYDNAFNKRISFNFNKCDALP